MGLPMHYKMKYNSQLHQFCEYQTKFLGFQFLSVFENALCIVDRIEVHISYSSKELEQSKVYCGKKKQHALNVLFITLLDGEIIFFSSIHTKPHNQQQWNYEKLCCLFVEKKFGILGNGDFTFNQKCDIVWYLIFLFHI
jgi:hypothetical protein